MPLAATHTFEGFTSGVTVAVSDDGIVATSGTTTYQSSAAIHGSIGVSMGSAVGSSMGYTAPAAAFTSSRYGTVTTFGASNSTVDSARTTSSHQARLRINATGHFEIANASNTVVATSTSTVAAGDKYRADVRWDNSAGSSTTVTVQLFLRGNIEGTTPDETLGPQTFSTTAINRYYAGTTTSPTWVHTADTIRLYDDVTTWPAPFAGSSFSGTAALSGSGTLTAGGTPSGAAAAALSGAGTLTGSGTLGSPGSTTYAMVGAARADKAIVLAKTASATSLQIGYSTDPTMATGVSYTTAAAPDGNGEYRVDITGLTADTKYYYRVFDTPVATRAPISAIFVFRTRTSSGSGSSLKIALGSCCKTATAQAADAFADLVGWDPHYLLHLGDAYYNGNSANTLASQHRTLWEAQVAAVAPWKAALAGVAVEYINSDHELNPDDTDTNNSNASSFNLFYKQTIPARLVDAASTPAGKYRSWIDYVDGQAIRFIMVDVRTTDRSAGAGTDNSSKTMLGATQKAWLKNELIDSDGTPTILKVLISDVPWSGTASLANGIDKWWAYSTERQEIADWITGHGVNVDFLHGDSHRLGVDTTHNAWGGFPVICGSPFSQDGGGNETSGFWDAFYNDGGGTPTSQYMRLTYDSPAAGMIRRTASGWDAISATQKISQVHTWSIVTASLSGSGTLTAGGTPATSGVASLSGSGSLSAAGTPAEKGTAALSGSGSLTAAGTPAASGTAALSGTGTLTAAGTPAETGTAALSGSGTLTAAGSPRPTGTAALAGTGTLTASAGNDFTGTTALSGAGTLTVIGAPAPAGVATLSGSGTLVAAGSPKPTGVATLNGNGTLTTTGAPGGRGVAALSGDGTLTTVTVAALAGAAQLSGLGTLNAIAIPPVAGIRFLRFTEHQRPVAFAEKQLAVTFHES